MASEETHSCHYAAALSACLRGQTQGCTSRTFRRNCNVYVDGAIDHSVYYIESGAVKLVLTAASGKQCLLAIYGGGDIFGELCLAGIERREGTVTAMVDSAIKQMPCAGFLAALRGSDLLEGLARYLVGQLGDQQAHHRRTVDAGQRAPAGRGPAAPRRPNRQTRPAQHAHRTAHLAPGILPDGGDDTPAHHRIHRPGSPCWASLRARRSTIS